MNYKYFCPKCLNSGKGESWSCGVQGHDDYMSDTRLRFPSKNASKAKWKKFINHLKSLWIYSNGKSKYADKYRDHVKQIERTIKY